MSLEGFNQAPSIIALDDYLQADGPIRKMEEWVKLIEKAFEVIASGELFDLDSEFNKEDFKESRLKHLWFFLQIAKKLSGGGGGVFLTRELLQNDILSLFEGTLDVNSIFFDILFNFEERCKNTGTDEEECLRQLIQELLTFGLNELIEIVIDKHFKDLLEFTYSYAPTCNGGKLNLTYVELFCDEECKSLIRMEDSLYIIDENLGREEFFRYFEKGINMWRERMAHLAYIGKRLKTLGSEKSLSITFNVFEDWLEFVSNMLDLAEYALKSEISKVGGKFEFDDEELVIGELRVSNIERDLYGSRILEDPYLLNIAIGFLKRLGEEENKAELVDEVINRIRKWIEFNVTDEKSRICLLDIIKKTEPIDMENSEGKLLVVFNQHELEEFEQIWKSWGKEIVLTPNQAETLFKFVIRAYGLPMKVKIDNNVSSVYDGPDGTLYLPDDKKKYKLGYVLGLIAHEIETHGLTWLNNYILGLGSLRGANYLAKEESLAARGIEDPFKGIEPWGAGLLILRIIFGEVSKGFDDFFKLMKGLLGGVFEKYGDEKRLKRLWDRTKRAHAFTLPGGQMKDIAYNRGGEIKIFLEEKKISRRLLWAGRLGLDILYDKKDVLQDRIKKVSGEYVVPVFLSEAMKYAFVLIWNGHKVETLMEILQDEKFQEFIWKKYTHLFKYDDGLGTLLFRNTLEKAIRNLRGMENEWAKIVKMIELLKKQTLGIF